MANMEVIEEAAPYLHGAEVTDNSTQPKPPKKRRSDAGVPRKPKPDAEAPAGAMEQQQANRLRILLEDVVQAERSYWEADARRAKAGLAYNAFIESLTTKSA